MAACELIRQCSAQVGNLWSQLNAASGQQRVDIGNRITAHIAQCVTSLGRSCKQTGADTIYFADVNTTYDVIENMKGTKPGGAKVSCHKTPGGGTGVPPGTGTLPGTGVSYLPGTGTSLIPSGISGFSIFGLGTVQSFLVIIVGILILFKVIKMFK